MIDTDLLLVVNASQRHSNPAWLIVSFLICVWIATRHARTDEMSKPLTVIARLDRAIYTVSITRALRWITRSSRVMTVVAVAIAWFYSILAFWIARRRARNDDVWQPAYTSSSTHAPRMFCDKKRKGATVCH